MVKQAPKGHSASKCYRQSDVKKVMKDMPFSDKPEIPGRLPRDMKAKQRDWLISGLKRMGAPMVLWPIKNDTDIQPQPFQQYGYTYIGFYIACLQTSRHLFIDIS